MSKYKSTIAKRGKIGDTSSKYGLVRDGSQFIADIEKNRARYEYLWTEFIEFIKSHDATPQEFCSMFTRYYEEFIKP